MHSSSFLIPKSILDNDFYTFTMPHAVVKLFPKAKAKYSFMNCGERVFPEGFGDVVRESIFQMVSLKLTKEEKSYLAVTCPYLDPTYLDFLQGYRYDPDEVEIEQIGGKLTVNISGYWYRTIMWEVPILYIICELYYKMTGKQRIPDQEVSLIARR